MDLDTIVQSITQMPVVAGISAVAISFGLIAIYKTEQWYTELQQQVQETKTQLDNSFYNFDHQQTQYNLTKAKQNIAIARAKEEFRGVDTDVIISAHKFGSQGYDIVMHPLVAKHVSNTFVNAQDIKEELLDLQKINGIANELQHEQNRLN